MSAYELGPGGNSMPSYTSSSFSPASVTIVPVLVVPMSATGSQYQNQPKSAPAPRFRGEGDGEVAERDSTAIEGASLPMMEGASGPTPPAEPSTRKTRRLCRFPGCDRVIKSQGHCQRHGAKAKRCRVEGCDKQAQGTHDGMCKRHWRASHFPAQENAKEDALPPPPEGESVYDNIVPLSIGYRPGHSKAGTVVRNSSGERSQSAELYRGPREAAASAPSRSGNIESHPYKEGHESSRSHGDHRDPNGDGPTPPVGFPLMPLVAFLLEGRRRDSGWHRNLERRARGLFPVKSLTTQFEPWERQLALVEILLLSGGTPYANFKDLAHAWGRERGFHVPLASAVCERRGEMERKHRSDNRQRFNQKLRRTLGKGPRYDDDEARGGTEDDLNDDADHYQSVMEAVVEGAAARQHAAAAAAAAGGGGGAVLLATSAAHRPQQQQLHHQGRSSSLRNDPRLLTHVAMAPPAGLAIHASFMQTPQPPSTAPAEQQQQIVITSHTPELTFATATGAPYEATAVYTTAARYPTATFATTPLQAPFQPSQLQPIPPPPRQPQHFSAPTQLLQQYQALPTQNRHQVQSQQQHHSRRLPQPHLQPQIPQHQQALQYVQQYVETPFYDNSRAASKLGTMKTTKGAGPNER